MDILNLIWWQVLVGNNKNIKSDFLRSSEVHIHLLFWHFWNLTCMYISLMWAIRTQLINGNFVCHHKVLPPGECIILRTSAHSRFYLHRFHEQDESNTRYFKLAVWRLLYMEIGFTSIIHKFPAFVIDSNKSYLMQIFYT